MLISKLKGRESGIILYGITPPKAQASPERVREIAEKSLDILCSLDIDGLVVYDLQDESERTADERPFPFTNPRDPFEYASQYLQRLTVPKIIYRPAGKYTREELTLWLDGLKHHGFYPVFVGLPAPDSVPKTSLGEAYQIWRKNHGDHSVIGAVTIPERHAILKDEDVRMLDKMSSGVSYFISQCIFNVAYTKRVLEDLVSACKAKGLEVPIVIFTLTLCGSAKTLQFLEWLGIHIPEDMKAELSTCTNPAQRSAEIAALIAKELLIYCKERSIPFGFNIESVSVRKEEVDASLELLHQIQELLKANGFRKEVNRRPLAISR